MISSDERHLVYLLTLQYEGTCYAGWQKQHPDGPVTVQSVLEKALDSLVGRHGKASTLASSRTDTGVHALDQKVRVILPIPLPYKAIVSGTNRYLPGDIRVVEAVPIEKDFHPIRQARWKEYRYLFYTGEKRAVLCDLWQSIPRGVDLSLMQQAASCFVGDHIFHNFYCEGTPVKTFNRVIYECEVIPYPEIPFLGDRSGEFFCFRVVGRGFLKQMVRLMVGATWKVGRGELALETLSSALLGELAPKERLSAVAPARGLHLSKLSFIDYGLTKPPLS